LIHLIFMHAGCETFEEILGNFKPTNWNWFSKLHAGLRQMNKLNFNSASIAKNGGIRNKSHPKNKFIYFKYQLWNCFQLIVDMESSYLALCDNLD
jgi:hypothetical protein